MSSELLLKLLSQFDLISQDNDPMMGLFTKKPDGEHFLFAQSGTIDDLFESDNLKIFALDQNRIIFVQVEHLRDRGFSVAYFIMARYPAYRMRHTVCLLYPY